MFAIYITYQTNRVVGSRDSGKTALVLALYRLTELTEGCIKIDGVDISKVDNHVIQKRIKIIHQDPIILSGSLRANLDPFKEFEDTHLINALERVGLSDKLINGNSTNLDAEIQTNCLSIPEKQLILIASSFLHKPKILIVQEAQESWAGGDAVKLSKSLEVIETVCREFPTCTILLFINQPQALKLCNKVLFIEKGKVAEQGEPHSLMKTQSSKLYQFMAKKFNTKVQ
ncbi:ABC transporter C family member 12 isoform X2 [Nilaparvata lugens]|uniref:ABC transporter C family member 12 isoform X2 n=1 Tax=Nilaparvata lugens TaxID=108931 RepID=UPI00193E538C|nr:ABC transporter C family member 12 isoform X2 [Nilaparvata lugens]